MMYFVPLGVIVFAYGSIIIKIIGHLGEHRKYLLQKIFIQITCGGEMFTIHNFLIAKISLILSTDC